ncbi:DUF805 domain-containing protein, partial [Leucobacter sp. wl10]|uniref:DUF805 domain-containing protein n=1 Tax=Leucobacter sp. wl10 TaxID=2304677 RepID=UPI000E916525
YWWTALFIFLVQLIPLVLYIVGVVMLATSAASSTYIDEYGDTMTSPGAAPGIGGGVALLIIGLGLIILIGLALLVPGLAISWRRLHDANFSGAFWCLSLIPSVGSLIVLIFMVLSSNPEGRRFDVS